MWNLEVSDKMYSLEAGVKKGRDVPDWFLNEPIIHPAEEFYLSAFDLINTGDKRADWSELVMFAERYGLDRDNEERFIIVIRELEGAFFKWHADKMKKGKKDANV